MREGGCLFRGFHLPDSIPKRPQVQIALQHLTRYQNLDRWIEEAERQQESRIKDLEALAKRIQGKYDHLQDLKVLMKIAVTAPMMLNYQRNEIPSEDPIKKLESLIEQAIDDVTPYSKLEKLE